VALTVPCWDSRGFAESRVSRRDARRSVRKEWVYCIEFCKNPHVEERVESRGVGFV
jgi:hypothetical protein